MRENTGRPQNLDPHSQASAMLAAAEQSPDIILCLDAEMRLTYANPEAARALRRPRDAVLGRAVQDLGMSGRAMQDWLAAVSRVIETGQATALELAAFWPAGGRAGEPGRWHVLLHPAPDHRGRLRRVLCTARDITGISRVSPQDDSLLQSVFEGVDKGLAVIDVEDGFLFRAVNDAFARIYGLTPERMQGRTLEDLAPHLGAAAAERLARRLERCRDEAAPQDQEDMVPLGKGTEYVLTKLRPIVGAGGTVWRVVAGSMLITEQRRAERRLARVHAELEERVGERTRQFESLNRELMAEIEERIRAEQDVRRSRQTVQAFLDNVDDMVFYRGPGGGVQMLNAACEAITGQPREAFEADPELLASLVHPDDAPRLAQLPEDAADDGFLELTYRLRGPDGWRWINSRMFADADAEDGFRGHYCIDRDVTTQRAAEEALRLQSERLQALMDLQALGEATDQEVGAFILERALALTGSGYGFIGRYEQETGALLPVAWSRDIMADCAVEEMPEPFHVGEGGLRAEVVRTGRPLVVNDYDGDARGLPLPTGHVPIRRLVMAPVMEDGRCVLLAMLANKRMPYEDTDAHQLTLLLRGMQEHMARRAGRRELVRAKEAAEAASRAKSEFLANVSHELRTPLNGVMGMLQLAELTGLTEEQQELVGTALSSARGLLELLSDILDYSKVEAGKLEIASEPFDVRGTFQAVMALFENTAQAAGIALELELDEALPERLVGDAGRIRQILFNLVGNAVKFTEQGAVSVSAGWLPAPAPGRMLLLVSDTGIGIPAEQQAFVFEPFTQVEGAYSRRFQGTGLGLGIVQRLVRLMGGSLTIDSQAGDGTEVAVSLPLAREAGAAPQQDAPAAGGAQADRPLRVLVVEDNTINRMAVTGMLQRLGHEAVGAEHGSRALEVLASDPDVDLVLMDVQMPVLDGVRATRAIRDGEAGERARSVPIVALTAHAMQGDRHQFLDQGMDGYLSKPLELDDLVEALRRISQDATTRHPDG